VLHAFDHVPEATRINVMIYETESGRRTRLYLQGPHVEDAGLASLRTRLQQVHPGGLVVFGGSLPPGVSDEIYHDLILELRARGVRSILDTSGLAMAKALSARPLLIKPNVEETEELLGRKLSNDANVFGAAVELLARGPENVVISQGADGAVGMGVGGAWKAFPPRITACSTVGAGDSMVAGTQLCDPSDVATLLDQVRIEPLSAAA
jgi:1-phosphofructokinase